MHQTFGSYLRQKRKERRIKLCTLASEVGISNVYLSYIETDNRPAPTMPILERITDALELSHAEAQTMYCLAGLTHVKRNLPDELGEYIAQRPYIIETLTAAMRCDLSPEEWMAFMRTFDSTDADLPQAE